ncbi:MAG: CoA transferase [Deltaproteobacteria bacterium]|nr:CoA transferase [Deltaproteobacteria bacterium]
MKTSKDKKALEGVRVVDFTWALAGPLVTKTLGDFGAEIIKIEREDGEIARRVPPFPDRVDVNRAGGFNNRNRNKYGMKLNMKDPRGVELAKKLVSKSHLVIENYASGVIEKWGLGYDELSKIKPDIIMTSMPGFGHSGPYRRNIGYGQNLHAFSSWFDLTGYPDRPPSGFSFAYSDYIVGGFATAITLAALNHWKETGEGCYIEIPQFETLVGTLGVTYMDYFVNHRAANRRGNTVPPYVRAAAPHGSYPCKGEDRWCVISVFTDEEWKAFRKAIGSPEWTKEDRYSTTLSRLENADELDKRVASWTREYTPDEVMTILQEAGVAAGAVREIRDLVDMDPQMKELKFYVEAEHPELGKRLFENNVFNLYETPGKIKRGAPLLGEHTDFICKEILGMTEDEINQYLIEGVL